MAYEEAFPDVHTGMADILVYFYARALQILQSVADAAARRMAVFHHQQQIHAGRLRRWHP